MTSHKGSSTVMRTLPRNKIPSQKVYNQTYRIVEMIMMLSIDYIHTRKKLSHLMCVEKHIHKLYRPLTQICKHILQHTNDIFYQ